MDDMTVSVQQRASISVSVPSLRISGQMPAACSDIVSSEAGMIAAVRGRAMRLVSMKYCGNVPK